jgi:signal transduction histidine kinase
LRFEVDCPPLSAPVYVDRDMWEQIVLNLVSNALKFTFAGTIAVSLCERDERVELRVRDTGVGIAEQELPRVFERFHRMHGAASRTHEGSGIGLALVSELVRMHGGTIEVASRPGEGTTFTVSLPTGTAHLPPDAVRPPRAGVSSAQAQAYVEEALRWLPDAAAEPAAGPTRKPAAHGDAPVRILLVDDNADMREYVARLLADRWTVETAADGHVALQSVRARPPSLIVSDIMMPRVDGFELIRQLRADPDTRDLPVILLSARAGEEASIEALAAGADDYVVKPFSARDLRARVEAQLLRAQIHAIQVAHDRRLADIFRHAPVAIAILRGPDHVYEFTNEPYLALIGHRAVRGKPIREALPELADQGVFQLLDNVYQTGVPYTAESLRVALNRRPDGGSEDVFFTFVYQPMRGRDGRVDGIAVVALDVTDLARARREAEAANAAKDDFLATLGHELRNPIAPILTAVRLLELQGPADERLQRLRETIFRQTVHLAKLVDDLLDVGRIITGKLALKKERVELNALVSQAAEACAPFVQRRRHTLHVTPSPTPVCLEADGARIVQIVSNLLNNAAKFMPTPGRIDVSVSVDAADAVVRVRDEGVGIDPGMRDRIFERFVQVDSTAGLEGGLGIGLSLVKAMVDLHGGTVAVHSEGPGKGSEFVVRLPAIAAPTPPAAA